MPPHVPNSDEMTMITASTMKSKQPRELVFVNGLSLDQKDAARVRREVRSHAARVSANSEGNDIVSKRTRSRQRRRRTKLVVWPVLLDMAVQQTAMIKKPLKAFPESSSVLPAVASSIAHLPFAPLLVQNYLEHLAVPIPEVDGPNNTLLLRTTWFPVIISCPVMFQVIALFSASHYAATREDVGMAEDILFLKQIAIQGLRKAVSDAQGEFGDVIIGAAAKMAAYEAIYGSEVTYHTHMQAVTEMVKTRGGLTQLGLNGFLARLLRFIDTNSAFLLGCSLYFEESSLPKPMHPFLPNPKQFLGVSEYRNAWYRS